MFEPIEQTLWSNHDGQWHHVFVTRAAQLNEAISFEIEANGEVVDFRVGAQHRTHDRSNALLAIDDEPGPRRLRCIDCDWTQRHALRELLALPQQQCANRVATVD